MIDDDHEDRSDEERYGFPIVTHYDGEPVPALSDIPRDRWEDVLLPLRSRTRMASLTYLRTVDDAQAAFAVVGGLPERSDAQARAAAQGVIPRLPPRGPLPERRAGRQVGFRLGLEDHARLTEAAGLFGVRPATLARILAVRGVNAALAEERRVLGGR